MVNLHKISQRNQKQIKINNARENTKRDLYDYAVGDTVYILNNGICKKLIEPQSGSYVITQIYASGTVRIQKGAVNERSNIRWSIPHFE